VGVADGFATFGILMSLHRLLELRQRQGNPLRVGLIGAGKFGSMYLAQVSRTPGVHVVGIADLAPTGVYRNLERIGWDPEAYRAASIDAALRDGVAPEQVQRRVLNDGSRHAVYKRYFTAEQLARELGSGAVLYSGQWFVAVMA